MEEFAKSLIEQYGILGVYLMVLVYIAQTVKSPAELQRKIVGLAERSMDNTENQGKRLDVHEAESKERNDELLTYLRNNDTLLAQAVEGIKSIVADLQSGQTIIRDTQRTMISAVESAAKTILATHELVGEAAKEMTAESISEKLDRALSILEGIDTKLAEMKTQAEDFTVRLQKVEDEAATVKTEVQEIKKRTTEETPAVAKSPAPKTKTQAQRESPPAQETHDKPLTDAPPTGG